MIITTTLLTASLFDFTYPCINVAEFLAFGVAKSTIEMHQFARTYRNLPMVLRIYVCIIVALLISN